MATNTIKNVLLWCVGLNYLLLFIWSGVFVFAHDWMFRMHSRWFKLSVETFDAIHYAGVKGGVKVDQWGGVKVDQR